MDLRVFTRLLIKMAGAAIVVWAVAGISNNIIHISQLREQNVSIWVLISAAVFPTLIPLLVGSLMLIFTATVTSVFVHGEDVVRSEVRDFFQLEAVSYSLLGLWLTVAAISDGIYHYSKYRLYHRIIENLSYTEMPRLLPQDFASIIATGAQFLIGVGLIFGAAGLAKLFRRLRGSADEK